MPVEPIFADIQAQKERMKRLKRISSLCMVRMKYISQTFRLQYWALLSGI